MKSVDGVPMQTWSNGVTSSGVIAGTTVTITTTPDRGDSSSPAAGSNVSTAAKAGIGVGVGSLFLASTGLTVYIFRLQRRLRWHREKVERLNAIRKCRDQGDADDLRFTRTELPTTTSVRPIFEADDGQRSVTAEA
jgi:hypothetical protein